MSAGPAGVLRYPLSFDRSAAVRYYLVTLIIRNMPTLAELMFALRRKLSERSAEARLRDQLSVSQLEVLWFVAMSGRVSMEAVASHLGVKPPSATALIDALVQKGFIARARDPKDRRVVQVSLTPSAKRQLATIKKRKEQAFESLLGNLSATDRKELTRLLILLTKD